ncbi:C25 family cysteine peptidase [Hymenobacter sp. 5516J-16]|uniref:putative type IX secretion system sortase PorU2 n=1 Tax=Hymenobacter sp. 5516J-16 TaxID=2932253 RepID=UPI001FD2CD3F|nr:C25 family cysteine peptidase [Hymenobacter sp. 5516J-16]UOQ77805.1 C25 family cysteine peptidase [Hymenobacter sp. 5516J-16]
MKQAYQQQWWLLFLLLVLSAAGARAQSGPYGNEWIVPGQQYYKVKVARDGLYRLDYQYLQQAGITGVSPQRLQVWRRGREVAVHVGGNQTTLDQSTFIEFFGQKNDGTLDRGMFKNADDNPQPYYSLFTDTAAYFITWSSTAQGRRMAQTNPTATATPHARRIRQPLRVFSNSYNTINDETNVYNSWSERGENFLSDEFATQPFVVAFDSVWAVASGGPVPRVTLQVVGKTMGQHRTQVSVVEANGTTRVLGTLNYANFDYARGSYELRASDRNANGRVQLQLTQLLGNTSNSVRGDRARVAYARLTYAQNSRWPQRQTQLFFANDSTLTGGPAYYLLDSIPATVRGYDVTDPYSVQRVEGQAGTAATQRGFVFADATTARTRQLLLADASRALVPRPAQRVYFRTISPAAHNFLIVTSRVLMHQAGTTANPVRAYANYRASTGWDTLVVTSELLYDQFHYGERSSLAVRQFAQWMLAGSSRAKSLLLLGKGIGVSEFCGVSFRRDPENYRDCLGFTGSSAVVRNLVPASTRGISDIFFTADWQNGDYRPRMSTGRIAAQTPQHVLNYLNKLKEHEALGYAPWRRNVLHMVGSINATEAVVFENYLNKYGTYVRRPPFAGNVVKTYRRADYPGTIPGATPPLNLAADFNAGLSFISYFGHGGPQTLAWQIARINDAANGFANQGKYPVWYISGCSAGNAFTSYGSFGEDYMLAENKGVVGFLSESDLGFDPDLDALHTEIVKLLFSDPTWYGKPVAEVQQEAVRRLQTNGSASSIAGLMNTVWQGDPALKLFSPLKPDFQTANSQLQVSPSIIPITAARFDLKVTVSNPGRSATGTLDIRVTRSYGNGRANEVLLFENLRQARRDTTYTLSITNPSTGSIAGLNTFLVEVDPANKIDESDETNNQGTLTYTFLTGGVTALSPPEFGIVGSRSVRLVGQSSVLTVTSREYDMELDTVQTFNSAQLKTKRVAAVMVPEWSETLPSFAGRDSVVWYWRLRLHAPQGDESPDWVVSSFRVINGRNGGWSQSHPGQFRRDERSGIEVAVPGGQWSFNAGTQEATVTSTRIGPAREWQSVFHTIRTSTNSNYTLRLLGVDSLGVVTVLNPNITSRTLALTGISAQKYPYLQLQAVLRQTGSGPAPQLEQWLVTYQGIPEGVVRRDVVLASTPAAYDAATLAQQARTGTLTIPVSFQNVADFDFTDPLVAYILVRDNANHIVQKNVVFRGNPLLAHSQRTYEVKLNIVGLTGTLSGQVVLNPRRQPEQYYFNNELPLPSFEVENRDTPPVLDVAFDGRHLLNGDIVSTQPIISIQLRDADRLRPMKDRSAFIVTLTRPNATASVPVDLNAAGITFVADSAQGTARLEYQPGKATPLPDGVYTLEVQGRDGSGNLAASEPYRITFEVISNTSITNVFPYPNPVISKTKFVFTLTGSTVPRNMKIQIVSLTGRVVKEIMMADLGPLRIGNNVSEYAWDGTDDYGDRLANGTYLYRVVLDDPEGQFKQRQTSADKAFKKGWGKLVLLR